jgi:2-C-methyl-D-erythritol 2,4-cyclodiphosphate synthase
VDSTVVMESPKLGPHREAIRERLASVLGLAPGRVNVKATTGEGIGFVGRGEGVAALAVVSLRLAD